MSIVRIDRLMRRTNITATRLGVEAIGDKGLVKRLRAGSTLQAATEAKLDAYLKAHGV